MHLLDRAAVPTDHPARAWLLPAFILVAGGLLLWGLRRLLAAHRRALDHSARTAAELGFALVASRGGSWEFLPNPRSPADPQAGTLRLSKELRALVGYAPEELPDTPDATLSLIAPEDLPRMIEPAALCLSGAREDYDARYRFRHKDGRFRWVHARGRVERGADGRVVRVAGVTWDIHDAQAAGERAELFGQLFDNVAEGVLITDAARTIVAINHSFERLTGHTSQDLLGQRLDSVLFEGQTADMIASVWDELQKHNRWTGTLECARKGGRECRAEVRISVSRDASGQVRNYGAMVFDITELEASRNQLVFLQNYDALTRLPNAQLFQHQLSEALRRAAHGRRGLLVLVVGIDRFQSFNEAFGRSGGDRLLFAFGERLARMPGLDAAAARLHSDRFLLSAENVSAPEEAEQIVARVNTALSQKFMIDDRPVHLTASAGGALFPADGVTSELLIQRAESALNDARRTAAGGGEFRMYRPELSEMASDRINLETNLRKALLSGDFECHFQPKVRLQDGACVGAEALVRWRLSDCWISPALFIPIAEESGLIRDLGRWVLWEAAARTAEWRRAGLIGENFQVAVNLAGAQLERELLRTLRGVLDFTRLPPGHLVLELTETILMTNPAATAALLSELREMGVRIALDDFGTGYTSMAQLQSLPLDELKLDQAFVRGLPADRGALAICRSVTALAEALKLRMVAEGIETEVQREALIDLGCRFGQGHLFGRAVAAKEFEEYLRRGAVSTAGIS